MSPRNSWRSGTGLSGGQAFAAGSVDEETGSEWDISARAVSGPLSAERLGPLPSRYTFWFAYAAAFPETGVYSP